MSEPPASKPHGEAGGPVRRPSLARRPYRAPELTEYGSVAKLTQGALTFFPDGPMGGFRFMMFCL